MIGWSAEYGRKWPWPDSWNYAGVTFKGSRKITPLPPKVWITSFQLRNKPATTQIRNRSDSNFTTMSVSTKKVCSWVTGSTINSCSRPQILEYKVSQKISPRSVQSHSVSEFKDKLVLKHPVFTLFWEKFLDVTAIKLLL